MPDQAPSVLVVHGPNLNLLGEREPHLYGTVTLEQLDRRLVRLGGELGVRVQTAQANGEGELVGLVQGARRAHAGLVINPGGYTHTSVALQDALKSLDVPVIEVHLTNLYARESFRHESITAAGATGVIMGLGPASYELAVRHLAQTLTQDETTSDV
jgi:3-dehydroquinate dehydratase-2